MKSKPKNGTRQLPVAPLFPHQFLNADIILRRPCVAKRAAGSR